MTRSWVLACAAVSVSALVPPRTATTAATKPKASFVADFMTAAQNAVAPSTGDKAAQKLVDAVCAPTGVDADAVAALCASYAQYEDLASDTFTGPGQIAKYFAEKYPEGTRVVCDRIAGPQNLFLGFDGDGDRRAHDGKRAGGRRSH